MTEQPQPSLQILLLVDALNAEGEPRAAVARPTVSGRRGMLAIFPTVAAALAAKREMEAGR